MLTPLEVPNADQLMQI